MRRRPAAIRFGAIRMAVFAMRDVAIAMQCIRWAQQPRCGREGEWHVIVHQGPPFELHDRSLHAALER
jgi:hypothetical protein